MKKHYAQATAIALSLVLSAGSLFGCGQKNESSGTDADGKKKVTIAYAGGTCEAPVFVAYHKGFFEDEGLSVELVQAGFDELKQGLATGKVDAALANLAWFKPIEQGMSLKLTAGIHTGCIKAVVPPDSDIKTFADLKGKTVGVDAIGGGPQIALSAKLREEGIDPNTDVTWVAYNGNLLDEAIKKGEIQAYMTWDPFPTKAHDNEDYRFLLDIGADAPFNDKYCCFVGVSSGLVENDPETAGKITKALMKSSEWVQENPVEAAKISLDNNYVGGDLDLNSQLLSEYGWTPSVEKAQENIKWYISELKEQGILEKSTEEDTLYGITFVDVINE